MCIAFIALRKFSLSVHLCALHTLINTNWAIQRKENSHVNSTFISSFRVGFDLNVVCFSGQLIVQNDHHVPGMASKLH